ncbi:Potassium transporter [Cupriavidus taiwanensis]|uniref:monovalent cation:proton antiporter-2 (CPA2) family protein n=1 Tax=Cupriavidus taiwanensis TaxID=164546 RepID=UPI000E1883BF|nr:monovalent cation:proton antiporter-2 (CPA2) family protein [Cupriavidus taiwanensis]SOZ18774.1 Potassium transporter [Cupriavidus taiwanensis]SOZ32040.1 Potassium transporter [Cupriavidus taiwanensis]SOZ47687.1 Potassium transporter [Cupriavidus taiwanensis]SPA16015.1 Potassium transporter [Cupriavidus taiwanensis]
MIIDLFLDSVVFLAAALIMVPLSVRLGFGSVLGYLVAGVVIGPSVLGLVVSVDPVFHISEMGIMLMMFVIGIEMDVGKLWDMRRSIFGYGGIQVTLCGVLLAAIFIAFGVDWRVGVAAGLALSLSSTAMVIAILEQSGQIDSPVGRTSFGILLFQDIAAIPMIALLPLLAPTPVAETTTAAGWALALKALGMLAAVVIGGRFLLRMVLPAIRRTGARDMFTVFALFWVIGIALLMHSVQLSMSLGAFVAGVLLAGSEGRHEIESDMAPFKGVLLGLFFMAVGMSIDFGVLVHKPVMVAVLVIALVGAKWGALWFLARRFGLPRGQRAYFAILLSQGGEFAFVVMAAAQDARLLNDDQLSVVTAVVALSMAATPLLLLAHKKLAAAPRTDERDLPVEQV